MKYTDHHVHTNYSPDGEGKVEGYVLKAKEMGLEFVTFTDHADFGTKDKDFMVHIDYDKYFHMMKELEEKHNIPIKIGVEIGYEKNQKEEIRDFLGKYPFDFVISSIHYGDGRDFYLGDFFHGKNQNQSYMRYFEILLEMVENFYEYDVVGHLDYITRYGPFENKYYEYEKYKEIIDKISKEIIEKGKGIELNTSGIREEINDFYPKKQVLERYRELGGKTITIGSDSHRNIDYHAGIKEGIALLKSVGFKEISYFHKRIEKKISLNTKQTSLGY
ncbi:MAG: histidinol-phosphatase HisJ family protein [Tissierellaceae bacterium]